MTPAARKNAPKAAAKTPAKTETLVTPAPVAAPAPKRAAPAAPKADAVAAPSKAGPKASAPKAASASPASQGAAKTAKVSADEKPRKPKLVRDSFTIPKNEYTVIEALKTRAAQAGAPYKKSEVLRAGIKLLATLDDGAFAAAMQAVPAIKTGRPAKG